MRTILAMTALLGLSAGVAFAASEGKFSKATVDGVNKALAEAGCKGGELFSGSSGYEVGGAECADGKYNVTIDSMTFKITAKTKKP